MNKRIVSFALLASVLAGTWWQYGPRDPAEWTQADLSVLRSLAIDSLPPLPADPSNRFADNPRAAKLGHKLFFDTQLSASGTVSCATCHQPDKRFSDGLPKGRGIGLSGRNTRSIVGTAYSPWFYWDGRKDSQWSQALSPLEDPAEHGGNRMRTVRFVTTDSEYQDDYVALFGPPTDFSDRDRFPDDAGPLEDENVRAAWDSMSTADRLLVNTAFANIGKAIAAYERLLLPAPSPFDQYVAAVLQDDVGAAAQHMTTDEILGLQLYISKARCTECHNGPLFTNNEFHNTGVLSFAGDLPDRGRIDGLKKILADPFNCLGDFNDDPAKSCPELTYVRTGIELIGATRTPSLRNLGGTAPYSHKGQNAALADLIALYNDAPLAMIGHNEAENKLNLSRRERRQLEAFLGTLDAPLSTADEWLEAPSID